jgi:hypothetical protein
VSQDQGRTLSPPAISPSARDASRNGTTNLPIPLNSEDALAAFRGCDRPLTTWSASQAFAAISRPVDRTFAVLPVSTGSWALIEDVKGKPGWIANTSESAIYFPLRVGKQPKVVVTFLRTYTRPSGSISLSINGTTDDVKPLTELSGLWDQKYSLGVVVVLQARSYHRFATIEPNTEITLKLTMQKNAKFKIIEILSC